MVFFEVVSGDYYDVGNYALSLRGALVARLTDSYDTLSTLVIKL